MTPSQNPQNGHRVLRNTAVSMKKGLGCFKTKINNSDLSPYLHGEIENQNSALLCAATTAGTLVVLWPVHNPRTQVHGLIFVCGGVSCFGLGYFCGFLFVLFLLKPTISIISSATKALEHYLEADNHKSVSRLQKPAD